MSKALTAPSRQRQQRHRNRSDHGSLRFWRWLGLAILLAGLLTGSALAQTPDDPAAIPDRTESSYASPRALTLVGVELSGATRTSLDAVYRFLPLQPGQEIDQGALVAAVADLRQANLFKTIGFYTKPGTERGQLVLVLEVVEHRLDFRWAAGNNNLDGWYLSPAMVAYDNAFGRGGLFDLQWRVGFRHTGLLLRYGQLRPGSVRDYWGASFSLMNTDRPYFARGVEFRHNVGSAALTGVWGRRFGDHGLTELGLKLETVDAANKATAFTASQDGTIKVDQEIEGSDLPPAVQAALGRQSRAILHLDWQHDTRAERKRAGSPVSGLWGRIKGHVVAQDARSHGGLQADLRAFQELPGGVLAFRTRAAWVGKKAAFYDRLYLGGMYSVRGFPTHSLSAPGGDTWLWSGSLEYRSRILGDDRGTKLAGLFFVDAGASGAADAPDSYRGIAASAGYGVRARVWWLDWVGVDVGFPLTDRPLDMRFQATASIGWSF